MYGKKRGTTKQITADQSNITNKTEQHEQTNKVSDQRKCEEEKIKSTHTKKTTHLNKNETAIYETITKLLRN